MGGQLIPIQTYAMPDPLRSYSQTILQPERLLHETLQAEAVNFKIRCIGHRGQQVYMQIVDAVGGDGQIVGLGEVGPP